LIEIDAIAVAIAAAVRAIGYESVIWSEGRYQVAVQNDPVTPGVVIPPGAWENVAEIGWPPVGSTYRSAMKGWRRNWSPPTITVARNGDELAIWTTEK
jgi:hypothetical protein